MKPRVLITREILPEAMSLINSHKEIEIEIGARGRNLKKPEIINRIKDKQGLLSLLVDEIDRRIIDAAPELKIIANCAVGYNNIDIEYARLKNIMVTNTPGVLTETTADLTWALLFSTARLIPAADRFARAGKFTGWELDLLLGQEISGKRLGIIGMGRIGKAVALRAQGFQMDTVYFDPHRLPPDEEDKYRAQYLSFDQLIATSDYITLHTTLNDATRHLIGMPEFKRMKKEAVLINVSRGPVVDEKALVSALESGLIWGAGLDVFEREPAIEDKLKQMDKVVLLPHIGSASYETRLKMAMTAAKNLIQGVTGQTPDNLVE